MEQGDPEWSLHIDRSSCRTSNGASLLLVTVWGLNLEYTIKFSFTTSNNIAEYKALISSQDGSAPRREDNQSL